MKPWHIIVIVIAFFLLFGWKRLPDAARALGRSLRIFKAETKDLLNDDVKDKAEAKKTQHEINEPPTSDRADEPHRQPPLAGDVVDSSRERREQ